MNQFLTELKNFTKKGDWVLLLLCLVTSALGCVILASTTSADKFDGNFRYIAIQVGCTVAGAFVFAIMSSLDIETLSEHRYLLVAFNMFLLFLIIPFGVNRGGNKSWLDIPGLPFMIQPAEVCKITYIVIAASVMASHQNRISSVPSVMHMAFHLVLLFGTNMLLSRDMGVSLIFVFIFAGMAFAGGVNLLWFAGVLGLVAVAFPILWPRLDLYQQQRILIIFDETVDAQGIGPRWHYKLNLQSLTGGGLTGQGLFNGTRTQAGSLYAQHTDYVFSSIGEELGFFGCVIIMILELAIIARCIYVGIRCPDYMRRLICFGAASAMIFQIVINIGMCLGVMPVIGLTLPFFSYGGSSLITLYGMLGLVSGAYARPSSLSHERYIQPYR